MARNKSLHVDFHNVRITFKPRSSRPSTTDWAKEDVLSIRAYKGPKDKSLHPGPEIPISSAADLGRFVAAVLSAYLRVQTFR